ncbi:MAG: hypothetical protein B7Y95_14075 [Rhizobiales bacterium 32-66-11]|nr:MAG: hypothetical protein B7Y95_14075 [Rhizobiales bacterium 32-66-11]
MGLPCESTTRPSRPLPSGRRSVPRSSGEGGLLVWPTRGAKGFGYDPMFVPEGHTRTFAEMSAEEKHSMPPLGFGLSHRARAFRQLAQACLEA